MRVLEALFTLTVILAFVWIAWSLFASLKGTFSWSVSGERGGLMVRGFMPNGARLRRTIQLHAFIMQVALITRLNLPLREAVRVAADGEGGPVRKALEQLGRSMGYGCAPSWAIGRAFRGCPPQLAEMLRHGELCGQLPQAVADVEGRLASLTRGQLGQTDHRRHVGTYAFLMFVGVAFILNGVVIIIMPKFRAIFEDFNTPLPAITQMLFDGWDGTLFKVAAVLFLVPAFLSAGLALLSRLQGTDPPGPLARTIGSLRWAVPFTRAMDYGLGMATAIRSLACAIRSGRPLDRSMDLTKTVSATNHLRCRLGDFVRDVHAGAAPHAAAKDAKLGDMFVSALQMIERGEDPDPILSHAADYYEAIAYRWWHTISVASGPLITLAMGAVVGFVAFALFMPLIALTNAVAESIP